MDDSAAIAAVSAIKQWWDYLLVHGPSYGYHVNNSKMWLVLKPTADAEAREVFLDSQINAAN